MMRAKDSLFDCLERNYMGYSRYDESQFCFLNRSARENASDILMRLDSWFASFPEDKKRRLRGHFRSNDHQHHGALLELVSHEILGCLGYFVEADPDLNGKTPDYMATIGTKKILIECTVSQSSDDESEAFRELGCILQAIDSIETGNLCFDVTVV